MSYTSTLSDPLC